MLFGLMVRGHPPHSIKAHGCRLIQIPGTMASSWQSLYLTEIGLCCCSTASTQLSTSLFRWKILETPRFVAGMYVTYGTDPIWEGSTAVSSRQMSRRMAIDFSGCRPVRSATPCTVRVFRHDFAFEYVIGSHACSLEVNMRLTKSIPLGYQPTSLCYRH